MLGYSQGFATVNVGQHGTIGESDTVFALVDGGTGPDTITRTSGDFTTKFKAGDKLRILGAVDSSDDVEVTIVSVAALTITLETGVFTTGQAAGSQLALVVPAGGTFPDVFNGGTLNLYGGSRPDSPNDDIGTSSVLATIENVQFGAPAWDSVNEKAYVEASFSGNASAAGTGTWWRITAPGDNASGTSTTAKRLDGSLGIATGDINLKSVAFSINDPLVFTLRLRIGLRPA